MSRAHDIVCAEPRPRPSPRSVDQLIMISATLWSRLSASPLQNLIIARLDDCLATGHFLKPPGQNHVLGTCRRPPVVGGDHPRSHKLFGQVCLLGKLYS